MIQSPDFRVSVVMWYINWEYFGRRKGQLWSCLNLHFQSILGDPCLPFAMCLSLSKSVTGHWVNAGSGSRPSLRIFLLNPPFRSNGAWKAG